MPLTHIRRLIEDGHYRCTAHAIQKMAERRINRKEIEDAVLNGEIIEEYPQDKYSPSCLVYGKTMKGRAIHVVCSHPPTVWIVTAYDPDPKEWINHKVRREVK